MPIEVQLTSNAKEISAKFAGKAEGIRGALIKGITEATLKLELLVKQKLSGDVLNVKSGALRRSINSAIDPQDNTVTGTVFSSGDVKYAAIHEYGGVINHPGGTPYIFTKDFGVVFISKVTASHFKTPPPVTKPHEIPMPERSFLRSSLSESKGDILATLQKSVADIVKT